MTPHGGKCPMTGSQAVAVGATVAEAADGSRGTGKRVAVGVRKDPRRTANPAANWSFDSHSIIIFTDTVFYFSSRVHPPLPSVDDL